MRQLHLFTVVPLKPPHGPGCREMPGSHSFRDPGEPRYMCTAACPRSRWHDQRLIEKYTNQQEVR
jgi:hypothetical protein